MKTHIVFSHNVRLLGASHLDQTSSAQETPATPPPSITKRILAIERWGNLAVQKEQDVKKIARERGAAMEFGRQNEQRRESERIVSYYRAYLTRLLI